MSGRPEHILLDLLHKIFEDNKGKIISVDNKVIVPSDTIWTEIREKIEKQKSSKSIYNDALRWWRKSEENVKHCEQSDIPDGNG